MSLLAVADGAIFDATEPEAVAESEYTEMGEAGDTGQLVLDEWSTTPLKLEEPLARRLGQTPWVWVQPGREAGWWRVSTRQMVGAFTLGDLRIIVRPKIKPQNLFLMLEVGLPAEAWQAEAFDYATNDDLLAALVSFFARTAETTLARGLFHHYRHESDDLLALRGRIDFVRQFRRGGVLVPMACEWDDFTADVDENRCLLAAIRLSLRVPDVPHEDRRRLRRLVVALDGVTETAASAALESLDRIGFTRLNEHYRPALELARLLLANRTLADQHGQTSASSFMVDMNDLFERFVTVRLQRALRGRLSVRPQTRPHLDDEHRVQLRPDLVFDHRARTVGVADIKYKLTNASGADEASNVFAGETPSPVQADSGGTSPAGAAGPLARHGDYYQLLAYTTALGLEQGTLIYCADVNDDKAALQRSSRAPLAKSAVTVRHLGTKLHTVAIDLSGDPMTVEAQIEALAEHLVEAI